MGIILAGGKCGARDEGAAVKHWSAAAQQGDVWSKYRLATMTHLAKHDTDETASNAPASDRVLTPRRAAASLLIHAQVFRTGTCLLRRNCCIITR
jgi:hypothetical protein